MYLSTRLVAPSLRLQKFFPSVCQVVSRGGIHELMTSQMSLDGIKDLKRILCAQNPRLSLGLVQCGHVRA